MFGGYDASRSRAPHDDDGAMSHSGGLDGDHLAERVVRGLDLDGDESDGGASSSTATPAPPAEHACAYCGIDDAPCVVRCVASGRWFCNSRHNSLPASCAVYHLIRSRCKEVQLHRDSPLGEMVLECYLSGNKNVFTLGFVPCVDEEVVVLLGRDAATAPASARDPALRDLDLDLDQWQPLVADKRFLPWLVAEPASEQCANARRVTASMANALEELWKTNPDASMSDVETGAAGASSSSDAEPQPVALRYADAYQYQNVFAPLIKHEADYDKEQRESQSKDGVSVRWDVGLSGRRVAYFRFSSDEDSTRLVVGDELRLRRGGGGQGNNASSSAWSAVGQVVKFTANEEVGVELRSQGGRTAPTDVHDSFSVDFLWKSTAFDRAQQALRAFALDETSVSGYVYHLLLGHDAAIPPTFLDASLPEREDAPNLPPLNDSQRSAVRAVLRAPLSLIQGPPGTGKTVTSASVVYHLATRNARGQQVLVCAPSNVAVDQLAEKIEKTGLRVVRVAARSRESVASPVEHLTLHYQAQALRRAPGGRHRELSKLQQLKDELGELSSKDERRHRALTERLELDILEAADVVCATCAGAGDPRLAKFRFRAVLVDESTQATEPECLVPLVAGAKQVVMVGDHRQLGPVVTCKRAQRAGLGQSMFERLILLGVRPVRLQTQYRMHPCLSAFPSNAFYDGALQNGVTASDRASASVPFPWPNPNKPMMFWTHLGAEELSASGTSYLNRGEAASVEKIVTLFLRAGVAPERVGVVTPYEGQRSFVTAHFQRHGALRPQLYARVEVASVDAFQGREKDFIVLSCVRSNENQGVGFLDDPRRVNVAITRARLGLVVLGNPKVLSKASTLFHDLIVHFREADAFVEGGISDLKPCTCVLTKPERRHRGGKNGNGNGNGNDWERTKPPPGAWADAGLDGGRGEGERASGGAYDDDRLVDSAGNDGEGEEVGAGFESQGSRGGGYYGDHNYVGYGYERGKGDASYGYGFERADAFAIPGLPAASFFSDEARAERRAARGGSLGE
jgi:regulator of nonsense transcripts 1